MKDIKQIRQDEVDYSLCKLLVDYLHSQGLIAEDKWQSVSETLKERFTTATLMIGDNIVKRSH